MTVVRHVGQWSPSTIDKIGDAVSILIGAPTIMNYTMI